MQLINPAIYEKQSADRTKAIEETRLARLKQRDERENLRLSNNLARFGSDGTPRNPTMPAPQNLEHIIDGIRFQFSNDWRKLKRIDGDETAAKLTPKTALVFGVPFIRSKHGNLYKNSIVKAQRYGPTATPEAQLGRARLTHSDTSKTGIVKKIDEPCKIFSTTGTFIHSNRTAGLLYAFDRGRIDRLILTLF